jgi:hypothetical protein
VHKSSRRVSLTVAVAGLAVTALAGSASAAADHATPARPNQAVTFGVIGDIPYGDAEAQAFPQRIAQINADRDLRFVQHLGDIKNGSSVCSDDYFRLIRSDFDGFRHPFVYAIGDNEWTDCHRPNNGGYNPLERLDALRRTFFAQPDRSLGSPSTPLQSQAAEGYPEESRYQLAGVSFASLHIVGSNNSLAPWTGQTTATPQQTAEVLGRTADSIEVIRQTFADAVARGDRAVALMIQADMFDPTVANPSYADYYGFTPIVRVIAQESRAFGKPVYLFNGDSHSYNDDHPLAAGSKWLSFYGVDQAVPNLERATVDGSSNATNYLRVTITPAKPKSGSGRVLEWQRVPYTP